MRCGNLRLSQGEAAVVGKSEDLRVVVGDGAPADHILRSAGLDAAGFGWKVLGPPLDVCTQAAGEGLGVQDVAVTPPGGTERTR